MFRETDTSLLHLLISRRKQGMVCRHKESIYRKPTDRYPDPLVDAGFIHLSQYAVHPHSDNRRVGYPLELIMAQLI